MTSIIKPLTRTERDELRKRYRDDMLYKAWSHPLMQLERELQQPAPEMIWYMTEHLHVRLRELGDDAPYEIDYLFRDLYEPLVGDDITRGEAIFTAAVVSTVLLSQLCAAQPSGEGENPHRPSCRALARILTQDEFLLVVGSLMDMLKEERFDMAGRKVIVPVTNYLDEAESSKSLSAATRKEIDGWVDKIMLKSGGIFTMFVGITPTDYRQLWTKVLSMPDMLTRIKEVSPRQNMWDFNLKMVANVIGMMMLHGRMENNASKATQLLGMGNARNYIRNHADFGNNGSAFRPDECQRVMELLKERL